MLADHDLDVDRIQLRNTVFEGQNNVYLLGGEEITLVDTGIATPEVKQELFNAIKSTRIAPEDIDNVLVSTSIVTTRDLPGPYKQRVTRRFMFTNPMHHS